MTPRTKYLTGGVILVALLGFGGVAIASGSTKTDDGGTCPPGKKRNPKKSREYWRQRGLVGFKLQRAFQAEPWCIDAGGGGGDTDETTCPSGTKPNPARIAAIKAAKTVAQLAAATALPACIPEKNTCPSGMVPNAARIAAIGAAKTVAQLAAATKMPACVPGANGPWDCPVGFHFKPSGRLGIPGRCVADDDPGLEECPEGHHWDADSQSCISDIDPTDCPPDQVWDLGLSKCRPKCASGQHWSAADGACISVDPTVPPDETCPDGYHWVGPSPLFPALAGRCVVNPKPKPADVLDIDDYIKDYPEGGNFYQLKQGEIMGWALDGRHNNAITQMLLGRELFLAARVHGGLDDAAAMEWANNRRQNGDLTDILYNSILCCGWNDMAYGTWGYCGTVAIDKQRCPSTMLNHPGLHGRAIRPLTQHADNEMRLRQGLNAARTVAVLTAADKGNGLGNPVAKAQPGGDNSYPLLWMPGVDRKFLWDTGDLKFDSSLANPPEQFLTIDDYSNSWLSTYGCRSPEGYDGELVV